MPTVKVLSDQVANQIAAGEVVERPMSVIKELLENSIDSGATRIKICFNDAGKSYISIEDDGCGMSREDAVTALERHATSKLAQADDLNNICTFGFRGEALPSIASVSKFCLKTRPANEEIGTEIRIHGGRYLFCRDIGKSAGTTIEVESLFYNVPARLNFLKSASTESAHITRIVRLYALSHPKIHFSLFENGRQIFVSPANLDLIDRVCVIWGRQLYRDLMILPEREGVGMKLHGLLGKPGVSRASRQEIVTVVNGRPIDSRLMVNALNESYHTLIPRGRYPLAYLFLQIDPHAIDVNVHPAKREIRFRDESKVRHFILTSVLAALGVETGENFAGTPLPNPQNDVPASTPSAPSTPSTPSSWNSGNSGNSGNSRNSGNPVPAPQNRVPVPVPAPMPPRVPAPRSWQFLAQIAESNLVLFRAGDSLILFNTKFARERIFYERILQQFAEQNCVPAQRLLFPETLELDPVASDVLQHSMKIFTAAGFEIDEFGRDVFRIRAVPEWLASDQNVEEFIRDLIDRIQRFPANYSTMSVAADTLAKHACNYAARGNAPLDQSQIFELLNQLLSCSQPNTSPRGFKIFVEKTQNDLMKNFL